MLYQHSIEPTTTTVTAGGRAFLFTNVCKVLTDVIKQFRRERARTNTGRVSLSDTQNLIQIQRANARACRHSTGSGVRRGYERVCTVVDVQKSALSTFKHDIATVFTHCVHQIDSINNDVFNLCSPVHTGSQCLFVADRIHAIVVHE